MPSHGAGLCIERVEPVVAARESPLLRPGRSIDGDRDAALTLIGPTAASVDDAVDDRRRGCDRAAVEVDGAVRHRWRRDEWAVAEVVPPKPDAGFGIEREEIARLGG